MSITEITGRELSLVWSTGSAIEWVFEVTVEVKYKECTEIKGNGIPGKQHFYVCDKFMRIHQNRPLDGFVRFMRSRILCIVMYGVIKFI